MGRLFAKALGLDHMDTETPGFTLFVDRALNFIMTEVFNTVIPPLKGLGFVPIRATVPAGAKSITYKRYTRAGLAQWITNYGQDLPTANVWVKESTSSIHMMGAAYRYTIRDLLAAMMANGSDSGANGGAPINIDMELAAAALEAISKKLDNCARLGTSDTDSAGNALSPGGLGLVGLLNLPNTLTYAVPVGASGFTDWARKTPDEIADDMSGIAAAQVASTYEVESPTDLIVPITQYGLISRRRMGDGSDKTILQFFKETSPWVKNVDQWQFLAGAGTAGTDRMICYAKNPRKLWHEVPVKFQQQPPQLVNMEIKVPCWALSGGVINPYPLSVSNGDGI